MKFLHNFIFKVTNESAGEKRLRGIFFFRIYKQENTLNTNKYLIVKIKDKYFLYTNLHSYIGIIDAKGRMRNSMKAL